MTVPGFLSPVKEENVNFPEPLFVHEPKETDDLRDQRILVSCHFKSPHSLFCS